MSVTDSQSICKVNANITGSSLFPVGGPRDAGKSVGFQVEFWRTFTTETQRHRGTEGFYYYLKSPHVFVLCASVVSP